ncbi:MAG TPA: Xaa-Pro peptidase family protein [Gemmatimonadales bacterium]|nr:Xaa-Pro peptidase family protein [Gemmatimonadales bacterium]
MTLDRRQFTGLVAGMLAGSALRPDGRAQAATVEPAVDPCNLPPQIQALKPMREGIVPISAGERAQRVERARQLMAQTGIQAVIMEPGTNLSYFTGVRWGQSERPFVAVIPARGEMAFVSPAFEEARAREITPADAEVRVWQEDESPYAAIAGILRDRGLATGTIGVEAETRFFVSDGVRREAPAANYLNADPVTVGCRSIKSAAELALMQRASDMTVAAFGAAFATMHEGMSQYELSENMTDAMSRLGGSEPWALVGFGTASAFPHGTRRPQQLQEGDIVLLDAGCSVQGYQSDITRTTVFGKPTARQTDIWNLERRAQDAAFAAAQPGATCGSVDAAARKVITDAGFGPGYAVPGLPHRTGHGIGMDGHEAPNFVKGSTVVIQPGMCFSDEPTISIYGEFGIRLEDCLYVTESGPRFFAPQAPSIDRPFP